MNRPYNLYFDNGTGRVVVQKLNNLNKINDKIFTKKIDELNSIANETHKKINIDKPDLEPNRISSVVDEKINKNDLYITEPTNHQTYIYQNNTIKNDNKVLKEETSNYLNNSNKISMDNILNNGFKKNILFGIKKTILSDFNYSGNLSNNQDFKIGINKNLNRTNGAIFDCFYLFPNVAEINTKNETNYINEKKVEVFINNQDQSDIQYFPIDYIPSGYTIPFRSSNNEYKKIIIKNIHWNIFQSIDNTKYENDEILSVVPDKMDFIFKNIKLQINFEVHSQINNKHMELFRNNILPYRNIKIKNINPSNTCLYKSTSLQIDTLSGSFFNNLEIDLFPDLNVQSGLLCVKISVPQECSDILKGYDKLNKVFYGNIPFMQFILNFDYDII